MPKSILVVDDQLAMRRMFKAIFAEANYDVDMAEDGLIAYSAARKKRYDLVISDYHMPNCNGIELTKKLRALSTYKGVPILIVSTESNKDKKNEGRAAGANGWVVKPISTEVLLPAVNKLLD
ncbi:MAG: response regulator [Alteromonadaceae bacterium]|nr:MAG: response regulator [Alteromonadaceae bacterium]